MTSLTSIYGKKKCSKPPTRYLSTFDSLPSVGEFNPQKTLEFLGDSRERYLSSVGRSRARSGQHSWALNLSSKGSQCMSCLAHRRVQKIMCIQRILQTLPEWSWLLLLGNCNRMILIILCQSVSCETQQIDTNRKYPWYHSFSDTRLQPLVLMSVPTRVWTTAAGTPRIHPICQPTWNQWCPVGTNREP